MFYGFERLCEKYGAVSVKPLLKGWSKDKKYILEAADGHRYLLRLSDKALYEKKREQYELLQRLKQLGLNCSEALEFGASDDGTVYTLLSYLPGVDGKEALAKMTDEEAYRIGLEAGRCLRKLHGIAIPPHEKTWWERYLYKMPKKIAAYEACGYKIPMQEKILEYYKEHYVIMKDRPLVFCHGDYHLGNMIVQNGKIGIIDFDKNGAADPYDDLKPFCWNVMVSEYFETGLINGYKMLPEEIRNRYSLVITGKKGWLYDEIFETVSSSPELKDRVIFTGYVDDCDMVPIMHSASVFAYVSFYEGFGIPVIEGMASGVPTVTSYGSSLEEISDGHCYLCDPKDPGSISGALESAVRTAEDLKGENGPDAQAAASGKIEDAVKRASGFTWKQCGIGSVEAFREAYEKRNGR